MNWQSMDELDGIDVDVFWESGLHEICNHLDEPPCNVLIQNSDEAEDFEFFVKLHSYIRDNCVLMPMSSKRYFYGNMQIIAWSESGLDSIAFRACDCIEMNVLEQQCKQKVTA